MVVEARTKFPVQEWLLILYSRPTLDTHALRRPAFTTITHLLNKKIPLWKVEQLWKQSKLLYVVRRGRERLKLLRVFPLKKKKGIATKHHFFFNNKTALRKKEKLQELALEPDPRNDYTSL